MSQGNVSQPVQEGIHLVRRKMWDFTRAKKQILVFKKQRRRQSDLECAGTQKFEQFERVAL